MEVTFKNAKVIRNEECIQQLSRVDKGCGETKGGWVCHNEAWWWNDAVNYVVKEKQKKKKWNQWKLGGSKEEYQLVKKAASLAVYDAKQQARSEYFRDKYKQWPK